MLLVTPPLLNLSQKAQSIAFILLECCLICRTRLPRARTGQRPGSSRTAQFNTHAPECPFFWFEMRRVSASADMTSAVDALRGSSHSHPFSPWRVLHHIPVKAVAFAPALARLALCWFEAVTFATALATLALCWFEAVTFSPALALDAAKAPRFGVSLSVAVAPALTINVVDALICLIWDCTLTNLIHKWGFWFIQLRRLCIEFNLDHIGTKSKRIMHPPFFVLQSIDPSRQILRQYSDIFAAIWSWNKSIIWPCDHRREIPTLSQTLMSQSRQSRCSTVIHSIRYFLPS